MKTYRNTVLITLLLVIMAVLFPRGVMYAEDSTMAGESVREQENTELEGVEDGDDQIDLAKCSIALEKTNYIYDGEEKKPKVTVTYRGVPLTEKEDYLLSYSKNTAIGAAIATITGIGDYCGTGTAEFSILPEQTTITDISNGKTGVQLKWKEISGGVSYQIYRSRNGGAYAWIAECTGGSYIDTTAASGENFQYQVQAGKISDGRLFAGERSGTKTIYRVASPEITKGQNTVKGIQLKWTKVNGATAYYVYRSVNGGSYKKLKKVTTASYLDTKAKTNKNKYSYKIYACKVVGKATYKSVFSDVKVIRYVKRPTISKIKVGAAGITLNWNKIAGVSGYYIYRSADGGSYQWIATTKKRKYTDASPGGNGVIYRYRICAYKSDKTGVSQSASSVSKKAMFLAEPVISSVVCTNAGELTVHWGKNSYADGYTLQYADNPSFKNAGKVSIKKNGITTCRLYNLRQSTKYYVRVRAYQMVSGKKCFSAWSAVKQGTTFRSIIIVLDPGHDRIHEGTTGRTNGVSYRESVYNLKIAQYCKEQLEQYAGVKVYLTRNSDKCPAGTKSSGDCNLWRVKYAASVGADYYIAIHLNSGNSSGAEVYYPNSHYKSALGRDGRKMAASIMAQYTAIGLRNRGIMYRNSEDNTRYKDDSLADYYLVIKESKKKGFVGLITESCYMSSSSDFSKYLSSEAKLKQLGAAQANGIAGYLKLSKK